MASNRSAVADGQWHSFGAARGTGGALGTHAAAATSVNHFVGSHAGFAGGNAAFRGGFGRDGFGFRGGFFAPGFRFGCCGLGFGWWGWGWWDPFWAWPPYSYGGYWGSPWWGYDSSPAYIYPY
jgi:hypothetical protein